MSTATDMLAAATAAYQEALEARLVQIQNPTSARRVEQHDIEQLLRQVQYWQRQVALEQSLSGGGVRNIQVVV